MIFTASAFSFLTDKIAFYSIISLFMCSLIFYGVSYVLFFLIIYPIHLAWGVQGYICSKNCSCALRMEINCQTTIGKITLIYRYWKFVWFAGEWLIFASISVRQVNQFFWQFLFVLIFSFVIFSRCDPTDDYIHFHG